MSKYLTAYVAAIRLMLALVGLWHGLLAKDSYQKGFGHLTSACPRWLPALLFYRLYPLGLLYFAVLHQSRDSGLALRGALIGLYAYGTYDLSNWATLKDWPALVSVVDLAWGSLAVCLAILVGHLSLDNFWRHSS